MITIPNHLTLVKIALKGMKDSDIHIGTYFYRSCLDFQEPAFWGSLRFAQDFNKINHFETSNCMF